MIDQTRTRMTAAEFFERPETNQFEELLEGELIVSPAPTPNHQRLVGNLYFLLRQIVPNGEVLIGPVDVYLDADNVAQPDILWVAEGSRCVITEKRLEGPPDLMIEIFSPGTTRQDRITKFNLYERHGVREYWMADPAEQYVEVYRLEGERFVRQGAYGPEDQFESAVLGGKPVDLTAVFS